MYEAVVEELESEIQPDTSETSSDDSEYDPDE